MALKKKKKKEKEKGKKTIVTVRKVKITMW